MTTPINLTQLRKQAELNASEAPRQMLIDRDTVAALIDTAEAAAQVTVEDAMSGDYDAIYQLRETLNHYEDVVRPTK
jgi:predicted DNA-binding protein (UPF0251 family)